MLYYKLQALKLCVEELERLSLLQEKFAGDDYTLFLNKKREKMLNTYRKFEYDLRKEQEELKNDIKKLQDVLCFNKILDLTDAELKAVNKHYSSVGNWEDCILFANLISEKVLDSDIECKKAINTTTKRLIRKIQIFHTSKRKS